MNSFKHLKKLTFATLSALILVTLMTPALLGDYLRADQFAGLSDTGTVDPASIRFSQDSIAKKFKNGSTVNSLITKLKDGDIDISKIPPIRIVKVDPAKIIAPRGKKVVSGVYTLDNRRLYAFRKAGVKIPYKKIDSIPEEEEFKFTTKNSGTSIDVRP